MLSSTVERGISLKCVVIEIVCCCPVDMASSSDRATMAGNWVHSYFITCGKYFQHIENSAKSEESDSKLHFKCIMCMPINNMLTAYTRSSGNLRLHVQVSFFMFIIIIIHLYVYSGKNLTYGEIRIYFDYSIAM